MPLRSPSRALLLALALCLPAQAAVLRVCDDVVAPMSLDPRREFSEKNHTILQQVFEGLVRFDPEGRIEPALAESWTRLDPLTVEFKLRPGVTFHNGEPLDAEAVRWSIESFLDPKVFPGAGFLSSIEKVEVSGPLSVRVKTRTPDGVLLHRLAGLVTVLPPRYVREHGDAHLSTHPVGTGAFRFVRWEREAIVLEANPDYWLKGAPASEGLVFKFIPVEKQVEALLKGEVDVVTDVPGTETLRVMRSTTAAVIKKESYYTPASSLNAHSGPLADRRVRQALNYAVDREELIRYDVQGNGKALATLTMPGEAGHDPALKPYPFDPRKARRLLKEAGLEKGFSLKALVKVQGMRTMKIIAKHLSRVGVEVEIHPTTDAVAVSDMAKLPWDWIFANCPDPMSHSFFVQSIFLSSLSPFSVTGDARYDGLLARMVEASEPSMQEVRGRELDRYMHEEALSLFTYQRIKTYGVRRGVRFVPWVTGMPYFYLSGALP